MFCFVFVLFLFWFFSFFFFFFFGGGGGRRDCTALLRQKLQIKLTLWPRKCILTPDQSVPGVGQGSHGDINFKSMAVVPQGLQLGAALGSPTLQSQRFDCRFLRGDFFQIELDCLKNGTTVATLPGAWSYRVSAGTGWPCVGLLGLGEIESLISNFYLSVAARETVRADPSLRCTSILLGR